MSILQTRQAAPYFQVPGREDPDPRVRRIELSVYPAPLTHPARYRLDQLDEGDEIQNYLFEKTNQRSVPNIFISASSFLFS